MSNEGKLLCSVSTYHPYFLYA